MPAKLGRVLDEEITPLGTGTVRSFLMSWADVPETLRIKIL